MPTGGAAYYSGPGALLDLGWLLLTLLFAWRALTATYFREVIVPADAAAWEWLRRTFRVRDDGLLLIYRGTFFCRLGTDTGVVHPRPIRQAAVRWCGADRAHAEGADLSDAGLGEMAVRTAVGGALFVGFLAVGFNVFIRHGLWKRRRGGSSEDRPSRRQRVVLTPGTGAVDPPAVRPGLLRRRHRLIVRALVLEVRPNAKLGGDQAAKIH